MITAIAAFAATIATLIGTTFAAAVAFYVTYQIFIKGGWFVCRLVYKIVKLRKNREKQ